MTWTLDPVHSSVTFSVRHMMVATVRGTMAIRDLDLELDPDNHAASSVRATLDAASISTGQQMRDNHLRSADFLEVDRYPTIEFASTRVEPDGDGYAIHGDLTIRGVTRPVVLAVESAGVVTNTKGGLTAGFSANTRINREDFGLTWNVAIESGGVMVGKDIKVDIDLEVHSDEAAGVVAAIA